MSTLVPIVIEKTGRGERSYDIFSRLLNDRIVFIGGGISDEANLITSSRKNSVSINNLGVAYLKKGEIAKAMQIFLDAVEEDPGYYKSYYHLGIIYLSYGVKNHAEEELGKAKYYFLEALKYNERYGRAYLGLAKIYLEYGEIDKSKKLAQLALRYGLIAPMDQHAEFILNLN